MAAVAGILPETLWEHGLVFEIGVFPRRGFGKMPNPAAKMAALPNTTLRLRFTPIRSSAFPAGQHVCGLAGGEDGSAGLPSGFEVRAFEQAAEVQDLLRAGLAPEPARLLEPPPDDRLAASLDHAAADEVSLLAEMAVAGALAVGREVGDFPLRGLLSFGIKIRVGREQAGGLALSMSSLSAAASSAGTRLLRLRPSCQSWYLK